MKHYSDLQNYIRETNPSVIIYNSENNENYPSFDDATSISLVFDSAYTSFDSRSLTIKNNSGYITFNCIIGVKIEKDDCPLGDIITIYCSIDNNKSSYTLIMR